MKKQKTGCTLLLAASLALTGCASAESSGPAQESSSADTTAAAATTSTTTATTTTAVTAADTTAPAETAAEPEEDYFHGADGYFCLLDDMPDYARTTQKGGTCWLYAGTMSMETCYFKTTGSYISINPMRLLKIIYLNDKEEGFMVKKGYNGRWIGGWQWIIAETLSRGFDGLALDSSVILDEKNRDAIKENVRNRGGVAVGVCTGHSNKEGLHHRFYFTLNDTEHTDFNHDITIVGYDDHFPKSYFNEPAKEDGAWICCNSAYSPERLYYVSYCTPLEYAYSHSVTDKYSAVLSYDAGTEPDCSFRTGDSTRTANVFHGAGKLAAVGTYNVADVQNIRIEIYDSSFTTLLASQDAVLDFRGYHTVELDTPLDVTDFAVAVTYEKGAPVEGDTRDYNEMEYQTVSESGQSFVWLDGWKDLTGSGIQQALHMDFAPNNCCIKALMTE